MAGTPNVQNETVLRLVLPHCIQMRVSDLTAKQLISVPCPTCGVAPGKRCVLHSGAPRSEPHVDRKFSAAEAIETKRIPPWSWTSIIPLPANNPRYAVANPVTNSDLEVCRFPISTKVSAYSCRTTLRREGWMWSPPLY